MNRKITDAQRREAEIETISEHIVTVAFSSETPVERWFGTEILSHAPEHTVRLNRLNNGGPVLLSHDIDKQIGVVEKSWIDGQDRKGRAVLRFSSATEAKEIYNDIQDKIRRHISVGYVIHTYDTKRVDDNEIIVATDWEPLEISIVAIPADINVGVNRKEDIDMLLEEVKTTPLQVDVELLQKETRQQELDRVRTILGLGEQFQMRQLAEKHITEATPLDVFRGLLLEEIRKSPGASPIKLANQNVEIGMNERETRAYSLCRAIHAATTGDWTKAPLEREASVATAKKLGREPKGFFIPPDVQQRDFTLGTSGSPGGGYAGMDPQLLINSFIQLLRNNMIVKQLGAKILGGLTGDILIPKQTGGATAYWVAESGAPTESAQTLGQIALRPKTVGAFTDISRKLLIQSSIDVESFVRSDITQTIALAIDLAALAGTGQNNQPTGILATSGIGSKTWTTAPTFANIVELETTLATANIATGSLAYVTTPALRGTLKTTPKVTAQATYIWNDTNQMNGYPAFATTQMTTGYVLFGNWSDLIIGEWTGTDILVDPYTGGTSGTVRVIALQDVDIAVRYPQSFCEMHAAS